MDELYYKSVDLLKRLIATPSISWEEGAAADIVYDYFKANGFEPERRGNNVWAKTHDYDLSKPTLLLNSHIDTVKPVAGWTRDPFTPVEEDGKLYGLNDMVKVGCNDCEGCSKCCQGMGDSIKLDPLDIYNLTTNLSVSFQELLEDKARYKQMRKALHGLAVPDSAERVCDIMEKIIDQKARR